MIDFNLNRNFKQGSNGRVITKCNHMARKPTFSNIDYKVPTFWDSLSDNLYLDIISLNINVVWKRVILMFLAIKLGKEEVLEISFIRW